MSRVPRIGRALVLMGAKIGFGLKERFVEMSVRSLTTLRVSLAADVE